MRGAEEFEQAYLKYSDRIFRYLFLHLRDGKVAEDLTSEVFTRAWQRWESFDGEYVQAWFYQIAKNLLVDAWRRKKPASLEAVEEPAYDEETIERIEGEESAAELTKALGKLPENLRQVVILRFMENLSAAEVGQTLGISEGNVRVLQHRGILKLREILNDRKD